MKKQCLKIILIIIIRHQFQNSPYPIFKKMKFFLSIYSISEPAPKNPTFCEESSFIVYFWHCKILFTMKINGYYQRFFAIFSNLVFWISQILKFTSSYVTVLQRVVTSVKIKVLKYEVACKDVFLKAMQIHQNKFGLKLNFYT